MKLHKHLFLAVLCVTVSLPLVTFQRNYEPAATTSIEGNAPQPIGVSGVPDTVPSQPQRTGSFVVSQDSISGTMNPVRVRHSGYQVSDMVRARTDTGTNTKRSLTIDESGGWFASQAAVEVTDSRRLYALNGTFDAGVLPWWNSTYDPSGGRQTQSATFNSTWEHVCVTNVGRYLAGTYTHYDGTEILWSQTVTNSPLVEDFSVSFEFLYESGPLDPNGDDFPFSSVYLVFYADSQPYVLDLLHDLGSRNTWYVVSDFRLNITDAPSTFDIAIGLWIYAPSGNLILSPNGDYDEDGNIDGLANAQTIDLRLDNIAFEGIYAPGFEEVDMTFHAEEMEASVTGTSTTGTATITNPSYWTTDHLQVEITSNTSISFSYKVTLLMHKYENSSWARDPSKAGVLYAMTEGGSALLTLYTYVVASYGYENVSIDIEHPSDWENVTVLDPLLNDLTSQCNVSEGAIGVPNGLLSRVGWWEIRLDCPNYAESLMAQKYNTATGEWSEGSLFRAGNKTRIHAELGTATSTPDQGQPAQISWVMPNGTIWREESIEAMINGALNGTSWTLGGQNTTAGQWMLELFWTNGTEIAYAATGFDLYHASSLTAVQSVIETEANSVITSILRYIDTDNGRYLMQDEAVIAANWSSGSVTYDPNLVRNWWEADFDTSVVGGGEFLVVVDAVQSYFDDASCQFTLRVLYETTLDVTSIGGPLATTSYLENYTVCMRYLLANSSPVNGADITLDYTGPENGLLSLGWRASGGGNYSFSLKGLVCGLYAVTVTGTKQYHYSASDTFMLMVAEANTVLNSPNGTSDLVRIGQTYRLVVHYENSSGGGLAGADVVLDSINPSSGLTCANFTYEGNGDYYADITPAVAGTYTLIMRASLYNHVEGVVSFALTAMAIPTELTISSSGASVAIDQMYTVQLLLLDDETYPVDGASITVVNPPLGLFFQDCVPLSGGRYNITIEPLQTGTYQIAFRASRENYQYSTVGFTLIVGYIPTSLTIEGGVSSDSVVFTEDCEMTVAYLRTDVGQEIEEADFALTSVPVTGLAWRVTNMTSGYRLTFRTETVGIWMIFITSNKTGYMDGFVQFELEVTTIPSTINQISLVDDLIYGRLYNFTFNYVMNNATGIGGANVTRSGPGAEWATVVETGNGQYRATMAPEATGTYTLTLMFEKEGCDTKSSTLSFVVIPASMSIVDVQGLNALEGENTTLSFGLINSDSGEPIVGASVQFQIVTSTGPGAMTALRETSPGIYTATFVMSSFGTSDKIRVYASLDNYELDVDSYEVALSPLLNESAQLGRTVSQLSPFIFVLCVAIVGLSARRASLSKKRRWNIRALATKRRFDDMKSLIGVIVLHKDSGIPVFSKILKSGLDESLISGFIAAISQFRLEFGVDEKEGAVTPISDIIRVVRTKNLICAFITLGSPTDSQQEKLLRFAKSVGLMFDSMYDSPPTGIIDRERWTQYEKLFDDLLDGHLLDDYRYAEDMKLPRSLRTVAKAVRRLENPDKFGLETLAREMTGLGVEETKVYTEIADAIEKHYLVPLLSQTDVRPEAPDPVP